MIEPSPFKSAAPRCGERGFTLVEMLITVVIMAILVSIAVPSYFTVIGLAQDSAARQNLSSVGSAQNLAFSGQEKYLQRTGLEGAGYLKFYESMFTSAEDDCFASSSMSETGTWFYSSATRSVENFWAEAAKGCIVQQPHAIACDPDEWSSVFYDGVGIKRKPVIADCRVPQFSYGSTVPLPGTDLYDTYSARFVSTLTAPAAGDYEYSYRSDDGFRLWVDGVLKVDRWQTPEVTSTVRDTVNLAAGDHLVTIEWYEDTGSAYLFFRWS